MQPELFKQICDVVWWIWCYTADSILQKMLVTFTLLGCLYGWVACQLGVLASGSWIPTDIASIIDTESSKSFTETSALQSDTSSSQGSFEQGFPPSEAKSVAAGSKSPHLATADHEFSAILDWRSKLPDPPTSPPAERDVFMTNVTPLDLIPGDLAATLPDSLDDYESSQTYDYRLLPPPLSTFGVSYIVEDAGKDIAADAGPSFSFPGLSAFRSPNIHTHIRMRGNSVSVRREGPNKENIPLTPVEEDIVRYDTVWEM